MVLLDNDAFINQLEKLFTNSKNKKGTVFITFKTGKSLLTYFMILFIDLITSSLVPPDQKLTGEDANARVEENRCLIRATNGTNKNKRIKISTVVCISYDEGIIIELVQSIDSSYILYYIIILIMIYFI